MHHWLGFNRDINGVRFLESGAFLPMEGGEKKGKQVRFEKRGIRM